MVDKKTRKARRKFKKDYGMSRKKAGKMPLDKFVKGPVTDRVVKEGVKKAKKKGWRLF